ACESLSETSKSNKVSYFVCDVRDYAQVEAMIQYGVDKFVHINGIVNNAAGNFITPTVNLSSNAFDTIVDIVLKGSYNTSLAIGKYWIKNHLKGNILNIVTTYAESGSAFVVPSA